MEKIRKRINRAYRITLKFSEWILALMVLIASIIYAIDSIHVLSGMDWALNATYYELIYRVLLIVIGIELIKMLITHSLEAVLELMAFVIARKMLKPDLDSIDLAVSVVAFIALLAARHYILHGRKHDSTRFEQTEAA